MGAKAAFRSPNWVKRPPGGPQCEPLARRSHCFPAMGGMRADQLAMPDNECFAMTTRHSLRLRFFPMALAALCLCANESTGQTLTIQRPSYTVRVLDGEIPSLEIRQENQLVFRLAVVSGLSMPGAEDKLSHIRLGT
jgi:hypothetical protein